MATVTPIDGVGGLICWLTDKYMHNEAKEVMIAVVTEDGNLEISWTERLSYIERLGLLEAAKALAGDYPDIS